MPGGLLYGAMHRPISPILLLLGVSALTVPMAFAQDTWTLSLPALLPGLLCAPVLSAAAGRRWRSLSKRAAVARRWAGTVRP